MLDHVFQVVGEVHAVRRHLYRLAVAVAASINTESAEVDRPAVGDATYGLANLPGSALERRASMDIDENAPGNISQKGVTSGTDNETGADPKRNEPEVPLPPDDEAPVDEEMADVDASNSVSSEHPMP